MRKSKPKKRIILPDPKFNDVQVTRFVNNMMYDGKKSIAYSIFYYAVELAEKKAGAAAACPGLGRFVPYFERRWLRPATPEVSNAPRMM